MSEMVRDNEDAIGDLSKQPPFIAFKFASKRLKSKEKTLEKKAPSFASESITAEVATYGKQLDYREIEDRGNAEGGMKRIVIEALSQPRNLIKFPKLAMGEDYDKEFAEYL